MLTALFACCTACYLVAAAAADWLCPSALHIKRQQQRKAYFALREIHATLAQYV
jgi:hypothetical protein